MSASTRAPEPQLKLGTDQTHCKFSSEIPPVVTVEPGTVLEVETVDASDGQLAAHSNLGDLASADLSRVHPLTGPIAVSGARPGDVLTVILHEVEIGDWGWVAIPPGMGALADQVPPYLRTFSFEPGATEVQFSEHIRLPIQPFPGILGVAPETPEMLSTMPPRKNGGNMDINTLVAGSKIHLPVFVDGANFSIGDGHAMQGDGEVCGTALEVPLRVVLELRLTQGGPPLVSPRYETPEVVGVTGFGPNLEAAAQQATRGMVDVLQREHGLSEQEAYVLCSLAGNLKAAEVVNGAPMMCMEMPRSIFRP